ncbi:HNH endonuclease [Amycolatopsis sp. lyj-108]|uniref:HNH endonuclease n=1 Tax=Amycolatopsis sp. lyj-108 TaxID=2789286 RepID=UPI003979976D
MIGIRRIALPGRVVADLEELTARIPPGDSKEARRLWRVSRAVRRSLRAGLDVMAAGRGYCMYCGDGLGSTVDHFEPIARNPGRAFDWLNHVLACEYCNSHHKRDLFPVDDDGNSLLIDPTAEDPLDHLFLVLSIGTYRALTAKGEQTIKVCGLNRAQLARGRETAVNQVSALVMGWWTARELGDDRRRRAMVWTLRDQPHADVLHAMLRQAGMPGARAVFRADEELIDLLRAPELAEDLQLSGGAV